MTEQSGGHSSLSERSLRSPSPAETATTPFEANMVDVEGGPALQLVHPATLADALELARLNGSLPIDKLVQIASAIRVVEKATGLAADKLPSAPEYLTPIIQHAFPARHRIWPKRWQNALSMVRKLLRACDLLAPRVTGLPSSPAWAALIGALPANRERAAMLGFARWCSDAGIRPEDVTELTLTCYVDFRRTRTIRTYVAQLASTIRIIWNRAVRARLPGWPSRLLTAPRHPNVEALPPDCFPLSFREELATYLSNHTEPDAFDSDHQRWRPATASAVRRFLIRAASLVAQRLGGPEHVKSMADIVSVDSVEFILRHVYERSGNVWRPHVANFATYLLVVARDFVRVDAETVTRIETLRCVIIKRAREERRPGLSERVDERLMPFDDPKILRRLFLLPGELYRIAKKQLEATNPSFVRAAQIHEQGLMMDLLRHDPVRRYNLASIDHLVDFQRDARGRITRLWIRGDRVKNGIAIDTPIPSYLAKRIHTHLTIYRPHLRGADSPWLFPSPTGKPRAADDITKTLGRAVARMLGVTFTPHMMRHIVATQLYRKDPHNGVVAQRKLRHTALKTTERIYGVMSNAGANEAWQRELDQFRRAKTSAAQRSKRNRQQRGK